MKREDLKTLTDELLTFATESTQARISEIILTLSEDNEQMLTDAESLTASNETLRQSNEALRNVNNKLLLKVGEVPTNNPKPNEGNPNPNPRKFEDLFNDKGELK